MKYDQIEELKNDYNIQVLYTSSKYNSNIKEALNSALNEFIN